MVTKANLVPCSATRRDGLPCRAPATIGPHCIGHAPSLADKRRQGRQRGGHNKARIARLGKLVPPRLIAVYDHLEEALGQVHKGELSPQQATAMAALAGAMVRVLTSGELEERVRRLEETRAETRGNGRRPR